MRLDVLELAGAPGTAAGWRCRLTNYYYYYDSIYWMIVIIIMFCMDSSFNLPCLCFYFILSYFILFILFYPILFSSILTHGRRDARWRAGLSGKMERVETLPQPSSSSANVDSGWYYRLQRVFSALLRVDPADPSYN